MERLCGEPHPFQPISCMKKDGHDKGHWFMATWENETQAIEDFIDYLAESTDNSPAQRAALREGMVALCAKRQTWFG